MINKGHPTEIHLYIQYTRTHIHYFFTFSPPCLSSKVCFIFSRKLQRGKGIKKFLNLALLGPSLAVNAIHQPIRGLYAYSQPTEQQDELDVNAIDRKFRLNVSAAFWSIVPLGGHKPVMHHALFLCFILSFVSSKLM